jgi:uncharacterized repeat protein (TIGR01451 family)
VLISFLYLHPSSVQAASGPYADIIQQLDVEVGTVTLPGADAEGFDPPHHWTVTVDDPGKVYLETLRQRYEDLVRLQNVDWDDPAVQEKVARLTQDLAWRVAQQDPQTGEIAGGLGTVRQLAFAYHVPGTPYYRDSGVITDHIEPAILYERDHSNLYPENGFPSSWWYWEVSVPFQIIDILFAVGDQLSDDPRNALEDMLIWVNQWNGRNSSDSDPYNKYSPTGELFSLTEANGAWFRTVALLTGLYFRLPPVVQWGIDEINHQATVNSLFDVPAHESIYSFGVKPDFTFWDHGHAPNQLYGDHLFETLSFVSYLTDDSSRYGLSSAANEYLDGYFHGWLRWNSFHGREMLATRGRWPHLIENGELFMGAVFRLNTSGAAHSGELARVVDDWLREHPGDLDMRYEYWGFASPWFGNFHQPGDSLVIQPLLALAEDHLGEAAEPPIGARYYPYSEFLAVRRSDWYGAFAMRSEANPMNCHERFGDGNLLVMTEENYEDYYKLDGAGDESWDTVTGVAGEPEGWYLRDQSTMVGGVSLSEYGVVGMAFHIWPRRNDMDTWVKAHKSCFFFDAEIVCVGSDIQSNDSRPIRTYIRAFPEETHALQSGDGWLHDGAIGVVLPDNTSWVTETLTFNKDPDWLRLSILHGIQPSGDTYTLIYLPQSTITETQEYANVPDAQVLVRTTDAHVVHDGSSNLTSAIFFDIVDDAAGHACNSSGHLIYQEAGEQVESLAFYNPVGEETTFTLTIPMPASDWLAAQAQADSVVEMFTPRSDGFDLRFTLPTFGSLVWYQNPPDFSLSTKEPSGRLAHQGEAVTYTLTICNSGRALATPITVTDVLQEGMTYTDGLLCESSWGNAPVCQSESIHWTDVLSVTSQVIISYAARVITDQPAALTNQMMLNAGPYGLYTFSSVPVIVNPLSVHLPLVLREVSENDRSRE